MAQEDEISILGITTKKDRHGNIVEIDVDFRLCSDEVRNYFAKLGMFDEI